jgi:hypothetical protein
MNSEMYLEILGYSRIQTSVIPHYSSRPEYRKATRNMIMTVAAIETVLAQASGLSLDFGSLDSGRMGLVLTSSHGEMDATIDFLRTLSDTGVARPLLFQNSLHNATTGFAAIQFKLTGPVVTTSHEGFGGEYALELAESLLADHLCDLCWVVTVETRANLPGLAVENSKVEGAACLLVGKGQSEGSTKLRGLRCILRSALDSSPGSLVATEGEKPFPSNSLLTDPIAFLAEALPTAPQGEREIHKPGFGSTLLRWGN